jgi:hypothetical protein
VPGFRNSFFDFVCIGFHRIKPNFEQPVGVTPGASYPVDFTHCFFYMFNTSFANQFYLNAAQPEVTTGKIPGRFGCGCETVFISFHDLQF